jgi:hypothetical protein
VGTAPFFLGSRSGGAGCFLAETGFFQRAFLEGFPACLTVFDWIMIDIARLWLFMIEIWDIIMEEFEKFCLSSRKGGCDANP